MSAKIKTLEDLIKLAKDSAFVDELRQEFFASFPENRTFSFTTNYASWSPIYLGYLVSAPIYNKLAASLNLSPVGNGCVCLYSFNTGEKEEKVDTITEELKLVKSPCRDLSNFFDFTQQPWDQIAMSMDGKVHVTLGCLLFLLTQNKEVYLPSYMKSPENLERYLSRYGFKEGRELKLCMWKDSKQPVYKYTLKPSSYLKEQIENGREKFKKPLYHDCIECGELVKIEDLRNKEGYCEKCYDDYIKETIKNSPTGTQGADSPPVIATTPQGVQILTSNSLCAPPSHNYSFYLHRDDKVNEIWKYIRENGIDYASMKQSDTRVKLDVTITNNEYVKFRNFLDSLKISWSFDPTGKN